MKENYSYPLDIEWSQAEMICVMEMWQALENLYEKGMIGEVFLATYHRFKQVIKSVGEERKLGREFEEVSGYSLYRAVKQAQATPTKFIKMKEV